jgi:hypothetical protein
MKKISILHLVMILLALLALASVAADGGRPFKIEMTGANEAPGPGDPDGSGTAKLWLNPGLGQVCFELSVSNIALPATGAHIHEAPAGEPGSVVVPLTAPDASGTSSGCVSADRDLILDILMHPEEYYVNVHSTEYRAGAVRGQLSR